ncbi:MAG: hypothetical protein Q9217_002353 [Psora testacea]
MSSRNFLGFGGPSQTLHYQHLSGQLTSSNPFLDQNPSRSVLADRFYTRGPTMGNDGGSIPTRRELVKEGAKDLTTTQVKEIQTEQQEHYWATCALSHEPLSQPVVSDGLGTLYNKAAVLSHLLAIAREDIDRDTLIKKGEAFNDRLRSLKDVVEVKFHIDNAATTAYARWICPVTNKVLGPGTKAIYLVPCGHAFAEGVVREVQDKTCLQCDLPYTQDSIITILPTSQAEKDRLQQRLQRLKADGLTHSLKKTSGSGKKRKNAGSVETDVRVEEFSKKYGEPESVGALPKTEGIKNSDTASLTANVLAEQEDRNKRRKKGANENVKSLFSLKNAMDGKNVDYMTRGFSIPANAKR